MRANTRPVILWHIRRNALPDGGKRILELSSGEDVNAHLVPLVHIQPIGRNVQLDMRVAAADPAPRHQLVGQTELHNPLAHPRQPLRLGVTGFEAADCAALWSKSYHPFAVQVNP
jgi:hypothetical protein